MPTLPTFDELYGLAKAEIQLRRSDLTDFNEGSVLDAMTGAMALMADEVIRLSVAQFATLFFDTASGADLDALAQDRFGMARKAASASVGVVEWTRDAAGAYTILAGTRFRASIGTETVTVQSTATVSMLASDTTIEIPVQATATGRATNAAADTVTEILDTVGADPGATVTNPQPLAGGSDAETDEAFRDRIRRRESTLRRGTVAALETGALSVPGVTIVYVDESNVETSGIVGVYVGDPDGRSNDTLATLVETELENWRAAGILLDVLGSEREEVALELRLALESGADQNAVGAAVRAAIVAYGDSLDPGERARPSRIQKAAHDASEAVIALELLTDTDDLVPSADHHALRFVEEQIEINFGGS